MIVEGNCFCGNKRFYTNKMIDQDRVYTEHFCTECGSRLNIKKGVITPFRGWYNITGKDWYFSENKDADSEVTTQSRLSLYKTMADRTKNKPTIIFDNE